jgi:hypothetical protein
VLDAYPDWQIPAHVITTIPAADRQKATVLVRIGFDALDPRILPDMGVKVAFHDEDESTTAPGRRSAARMLVPASAVRGTGGARGLRRQRTPASSAAPSGGRRRMATLSSPLRPHAPASGSSSNRPRGWPTGTVVVSQDRRHKSHERLSSPSAGRPQDLQARQRAHRRAAAASTSTIPKGEFLALMGPSGSGKTTLLNLHGRPRPALAGSIDVAGQADTLSGAKLSRWRARHIGFVFQLYNLLPVLTAERNVELPLLLTKLSAPSGASAWRTSRWVVGLADRAGTTRAALGRPGAARRHRARDRHRPDAAAVRRADGRPRPQSRATRSSTCCRRSTASTARPSSWSRTTRTRPSAPRASLHLEKGVLIGGRSGAV